MYKQFSTNAPGITLCFMHAGYNIECCLVFQAGKRKLFCWLSDPCWKPMCKSILGTPCGRASLPVYAVHVSQTQASNLFALDMNSMKPAAKIQKRKGANRHLSGFYDSMGCGFFSTVRHSMFVEWSHNQAMGTCYQPLYSCFAVHSIYLYILANSSLKPLRMPLPWTVRQTKMRGEKRRDLCLHVLAPFCSCRNHSFVWILLGFTLLHLQNACMCALGEWWQTEANTDTPWTNYMNIPPLKIRIACQYWWLGGPHLALRMRSKAKTQKPSKMQVLGYFQNGHAKFAWKILEKWQAF